MVRNVQHVRFQKGIVFEVLEAISPFQHGRNNTGLSMKAMIQNTTIPIVCGYTCKMGLSSFAAVSVGRRAHAS